MTPHNLLGRHQHFGHTLVQICQITVSQPRTGTANMTHVPKVAHKIYFTPRYYYCPKISLPELAIRYGDIHTYKNSDCVWLLLLLNDEWITPLYKPKGAQRVISRPLTGSECASTWPSQTCLVCAINNGPNCTNKNQISIILFAVKRKLQKSAHNNQYFSIGTSEWLALNYSAHAFSSVVCELMLNILMPIHRKK
jgi:hypothetical protein